MNCRIVDLRNKEVINIKNGARLGYVSDVEVDTCDARLVAIVIYGRARLFGLLGREDDYVLPWTCIARVGRDIILVDTKEGPARRKRKKPGLF